MGKCAKSITGPQVTRKSEKSKNLRENGWNLFILLYIKGKKGNGHKHADHIIPEQFSEYILLH